MDRTVQTGKRSRTEILGGSLGSFSISLMVLFEAPFHKYLSGPRNYDPELSKSQGCLIPQLEICVLLALRVWALGWLLIGSRYLEVHG